MKQLIIFTALLFLIVACKSEESITEEREYIPMNSLEDVMTNLKPEKKYHTINASEEAVVNGAEGTVIYIPASSFVFEDGSSPKGEVKIELMECYSLSSIFGQGLDTRSGVQMLETNGMVYINAFADGKKLSLKDEQALVVGFPKSDAEKEMDLFYQIPFRGNKTWVADYEMYKFEKPEEPIEESEGDLGYLPDYPIEITDNMYKNQLNVVYWNSMFSDATVEGYDGNLIDYIEDSDIIPEEIASKFVKNNWRVHLEFKINDHGKFYDFKKEDDESTNQPQEAVDLAINIYENIPPVTPEKGETWRSEWHYVLGIMGGRSVDPEKYKAAFKEKYRSTLDKAGQKIDKADLNYYMMAVTKLGWINCDRFLDLNESEKTDFIVESENIDDCKIQLVFTDMNSIMNGAIKDGQMRFDRIPLGQSVKILSVKYEDGTPYLAKLETTIGEDPVKLDNYQAFAIEELEAELSWN